MLEGGVSLEASSGVSRSADSSQEPATGYLAGESGEKSVAQTTGDQLHLLVAESSVNLDALVLAPFDEELPLAHSLCDCGVLSQSSAEGIAEADLVLHSLATPLADDGSRLVETEAWGIKPLIVVELVVSGGEPEYWEVGEGSEAYSLAAVRNSGGVNSSGNNLVHGRPGIGLFDGEGTTNFFEEATGSSEEGSEELSADQSTCTYRIGSALRGFGGQIAGGELSRVLESERSGTGDIVSESIGETSGQSPHSAGEIGVKVALAVASTQKED